MHSFIIGLSDENKLKMLNNFITPRQEVLQNWLWYLFTGAAGWRRFRQLPGAAPPGGHAGRGRAAVGQERRREADVVFGRAVHLRRAGHAW